MYAVRFAIVSGLLAAVPAGAHAEAPGRDALIRTIELAQFGVGERRLDRRIQERRIREQLQAPGGNQGNRGSNQSRKGKGNDR
jgi:hypothetical protein